jgi:REP element-mobilizing transposase RayT
MYAYVVMNDHVHVMFSPSGAQALERIVHGWKSFTAHRMQRLHGRQGRVWQDEYFDRIVRDEQEFEEKFDYIASNPSRRWPGCKEYRWLWPPGEP